MTIKKRIVIWYTLMMAVLGAIMVAAIVSASGIMLRQEALSDLREAVSDASEDIRWRSGNPDFHDVDFFDEGIYIQIFDESGVLIEGRSSDDLPSVPVSVGELREVSGVRGQWYVLDELAGEGLVVLEGELPSPLNPPKGCHFHPRCPKAQAICKEKAPDWRELAPDWRVRCHFVE